MVFDNNFFYIVLETLDSDPDSEKSLDADSDLVDPRIQNTTSSNPHQLLSLLNKYALPLTSCYLKEWYRTPLNNIKPNSVCINQNKYNYFYRSRRAL